MKNKEIWYHEIVLKTPEYSQLCFSCFLGLIKWLIRHQTPKKLFWHTVKKYKMGNIFINLETLGDLRQIFLPSLILNVFFYCSTVQKYCFWLIFIIFINFLKSFLSEIVQVKLVNGKHYEVGRGTTVCDDFWNTKKCSSCL